MINFEYWRALPELIPKMFMHISGLCRICKFVDEFGGPGQGHQPPAAAAHQNQRRRRAHFGRNRFRTRKDPRAARAKTENPGSKTTLKTHDGLARKTGIS